MKSIRKIAALVIVLAMVFSVAGVSMATFESTSGYPAKVHYDVGDGNLNGIPQDQNHVVTFTNLEFTQGKITFNITSIVPTRAGFVFDGWKIGSTSYAGGAQASNVAVSRTRNWVWDWFFPPVGHWEYNAWSTVNVVAQWREISKYSVTFENSNPTAGTLSGNTSFTDIIDGTSWADAGIAVPGNTPNTGYLFDGWYEGDTKVTDWPTSISSSHTYTARWTQIPAAALNHYKLTYQITSSIDGQPAAPANYDGYGEPALEPATPFDGYNFFGWSTLDWGDGVPVQELDENEQPVMVTYYEATVTGEYSEMIPVDADFSLYSLQFTGYADGMLFWPDDVINSEVEPVADAVPYLAGYDFLGWTPGDLDWENAPITSYVYRVMQPSEVTHQEVPYMLVIPVRTITVAATFDQEVIPTEPEIPTGVPATGDASWIVFAGIILLAGSAVGGYALIRRKDS